jgi:hypothetical protein
VRTITFGANAEGLESPGSVTASHSSTQDNKDKTLCEKTTATRDFIIVVPKVEFDSVQGADDIGEDNGFKVFATSKDNGDVTVKLKVKPDGLRFRLNSFHGVVDRRAVSKHKEL